MVTTKLLQPRGRSLAARAAAALAALACAAAGGEARAGSFDDAIKAGQVSPGPGAPTYGAWPGQKCSHNSLFDYVLGYLADGANQHQRPKPEADPALCAVADAFLGLSPGDVPRPQVLAFLSNWAGLPAPVKVPIVADFDETDQRTIAERIVQSTAGTAALNADHPRIGLATKRVGRTKTRVAIVVADIPVEIAPPLPRRLELGQQAKLSGKLVAGATSPKVLMTDPSGKLSEPEQPPGDAFAATLACGDRPGKILVELRGEYGGTTGPLASFPVFCGANPPAAVALASEPWPADPEAAAKKMFEILNAERTAAGVAPLKWDPAVAGVARAMAEDISKNGAAGAGDVGARLKKEGIATPLLLESAAADRTFERANDRIVGTPRDRATVLSPDPTNVGIGAVSTNDAEGHPIVYVVHVLIKELPATDVSKVRDQLRDAVAQKRKDARTTPVAPDATLDEVAQKYAQALAQAGGTLTKEQAGELTAPLNKSFRTVTMISGAKPEPLDFAEEPQATAPGKGLGIGVAQGRHPVLGRNAVYVVLMVGTPRGASGDETTATSSKKKKAAKSTSTPAAKP